MITLFVPAVSAGRGSGPLFEFTAIWMGGIGAGTCNRRDVAFSLIVRKEPLQSAKPNHKPFFSLDGPGDSSFAVASGSVCSRISCRCAFGDIVENGLREWKRLNQHAANDAEQRRIDAMAYVTMAPGVVATEQPPSPRVKP